MSERQAKKMRKEQQPTEVKKPRNTSRIVTNLVIVLVVLAVAGLGVFASWDIIKAALPQGGEQQTVQTIASIAEVEGLTAEELLAKCDLADAGLTADSPADDMFALLTVEKFAKYEDMTADELKADYGLPEDTANDALWQEAQMKMPMSKVAEKQYGISFDEFKTQNGLPEEITAEMTQEQALIVMQSAMVAADTEAEANTENE